jgi:hypothetical protein
MVCREPNRLHELTWCLLSCSDLQNTSVGWLCVILDVKVRLVSCLLRPKRSQRAGRHTSARSRRLWRRPGVFSWLRGSQCMFAILSHVVDNHGCGCSDVCSHKLLWSQSNVLRLSIAQSSNRKVFAILSTRCCGYGTPVSVPTRISRVAPCG